MDKTTDYWFAFEPYVYVTLRDRVALVYNTLDGKSLRVNDEDVLALLAAITDKKNNGVISVGGQDLQSPAIYSFLEEVREGFMGDLYECSLSDKKPIQLYPMLNLQEEVGRLQRFDDGFVGNNMFSYLYQVTIEVGASNDSEQLRSLLHGVWKQIEHSDVKEVVVDLSNESQYDILQTWLSTHEELSQLVKWRIDLNEMTTALLRSVTLHSHLLILVVSDVMALRKKIEEVMRDSFESVCWLFKIRTAEEWAIVSELLDKYTVERFKIEPVSTESNRDFLEENVFLTVEDILSEVIPMQSLLRNQVVNVNDFGKLHFKENGDVYANPYLQKLGNIQTDDVRMLIHKEMTEGQSWLRIRDQKPCCDCIYQWLCPSPSDYELILAKPDLCYVNGI